VFSRGYDVAGVNGVVDNIGDLRRRLEMQIGVALDASANEILEDAKARTTSSTIRRALVAHAPSPRIRDVTVKSGVFLTTRLVRKRKRTKSGRRSRSRYHTDEAIRFYRFLELGTKFHAAKPFLIPAGAAYRVNGLDRFAKHIKL